MKRIAALAMVAALAFIGCSSGPAPTPQIVYVTQPPTTATPVASAAITAAPTATAAAIVEPTPTPIPTLKPTSGDPMVAAGQPFYEALLAGNVARACALLPLSDYAHGACSVLPQVVAAMKGCRASSVQYESGRLNGLFGLLNAVFDPSCGHDFYASNFGVGGTNRPGSIVICQLPLVVANGGWKPTLQTNFFCLHQ